jgi:hypothetical protein
VKSPDRFGDQGSFAFPALFARLETYMPDSMLPPIMQIPGLQLVAIGIDKKKHPYLKFATPGGRASSPLREVIITIEVAGTIEYEYAIYDSTMQMVNVYRGEHGDPDKDQWITGHGLSGKPPTG